MPEFTLRSDHIDVEQIMRQIRDRIREKRGVDYTEEELRELANVKLERFLDPRSLRSDLLKHYREKRDTRPVLKPAPENYAFDDTTIYASHRGPLRWIRRLLNPLLKLFFNPNPLIHVLHMQGKINEHTAGQLERLDAHLTGHVAEREALQYEVITNLVLELTRLGIETRNLKMRVESLSTRLDFDERRARALEGVVQYRPGALSAAPAETAPAEEGEAGDAQAEGEGGRPGKRRRRRRGRRRGAGEEGAALAAETGTPDDTQDRGQSSPETPATPQAAAPTGDGGAPDAQ